MTAKTSAPNPMALKSAPSTSAPRRCFSPRVSSTVKMAASSTRPPSGRLTKKIQCHDAHWVNAPPASGPTAAAPEITAPQTPKATARYLPRNTAFTVDRVEGIIHAAPTAWMARAPINGLALPEAAATRLPATNTMRPVRNKRFRPHRSASFPVDSNSAASKTA